MILPGVRDAPDASVQEQDARKYEGSVRRVTRSKLTSMYFVSQNGKKIPVLVDQVGNVLYLTRANYAKYSGEIRNTTGLILHLAESKNESRS